ncbi:MAG TPA: glycoside hydrolase family 125 protein [Candidatus Sulfotelmatobacter sp.]|nr:glycoside hydrolase family 125 protein [Candidatus Sulfotelmatobacter sp.]
MKRPLWKAGRDKTEITVKAAVSQPGNSAGPIYRCSLKLLVPLLFCLSAPMLFAADAPRHIPLPVKSDDVIATGNEWIALPSIRATDGALMSFNVLSMRDRGLLEVVGDSGAPVLEPYFQIEGKNIPLQNLKWELLEYWIPVAHVTTDGLEVTLTYCAPPGSRAAFLRMTLTNRRSEAATTALGVKASWGALNRVTYTPVELRGARTIAAAPWVDSAEVFSFVTYDARFAWALIHPGSAGQVSVPPLTLSPGLDARRTVVLAAGETTEVDFVLGAGIEEFSASHNAKALRELLDRKGANEVINQAAEWCRQRTRTTGQPDLDMLMNRNFLFTALYAWGKTIDTEQFVGVTSRSPRYYVSAAYWDRDALLWSFPGLLDVDAHMARDALEYALTTQLRNIGVHSRFIDGVVLEDGFELDEAVAPILATAEYVKRTNDDVFLSSHRDALLALRDRLLARFDPETGLYSTLQDPQDEYQKVPFLTYDNVLSWKAMLDLATLFDRLRNTTGASEMRQKAEALRKSIMKYSISTGAPGATGPIFVCSTDGKNSTFADIPPGSLMKLPALGFVSESDPVFIRTYEWLHSKNYAYSYSGRPYGLPGSYRLPITTSWSVADHLALVRGREQALKVLRASTWDDGIITEGVDPSSGAADYPGRAFATSAGYVADAICREFCKPGP